MITDFSGETVIGRRAGPDVGRHRAKCRDAIRKGMARLVANTSIIGIRGKQKVSLSIPAYPEYMFEFGRKAPMIGTTPGGKQDDVFRIGKDEDKGSGHQPGGNAPGESMLELEVTLDELDHFLFRDLELPDFVVKQLRCIPIVDTGGRTGAVRHGPMSRLNPVKTKENQISRILSQQREGVQPNDGFENDDLRFFRLSKRVRYVSSAVIVCMMDVSGSMDENKKYLARAFFWLMVRFIQTRYEQSTIVFIMHTSEATECDEETFFKTHESGGTLISSAYELALQVLEDRFPADAYNAYAFHCSDGDNWQEDCEESLRLAEELCKRCNLFGYVEIDPLGYDVTEVQAAVALKEGDWSEMFAYLQRLEGDFQNIGFGRIRSRYDVYPAFRGLLEREREKGGRRVST